MGRRDKKPQLNPAAGVITGKNACAPGFTLIEVMIALVVLALGLLALAQLQVAAINGLAYSRHFSVATQLAEGQMERLMSYPFSESEVNHPNYYPKDKNGKNLEAELTSGTKESPFYDVITLSTDTTTGETISNGDVGATRATRLWLPQEVNERGQPAGSSEKSYLVTWTVERGGSRGTPGPTDKTYHYLVNGSQVVSTLGIPGPYQVRLVVSVIWFEKGDKLTAKSPRSSFLGSKDDLIAGHRSTIEGMRELSAKE
jgi:type IV pilus modification protein PilV